MSLKLSPQHQESSLLDAVSDVVMTLDQNLQIQWANQKATDLINDHSKNLVGRDCYQVICSRQAACEYCPVQMTIKTGETQKREREAPDGRYHKVKSYPLHSQEGILDGVAVISQAISDRKRGEQALRQSEERFYWAMEATQEGVWDWDLTTDEIYYSPAYAAMLGYTRDEVPPYASFWLDHLHPEDKELAFRANKDCIENRRKNFESEFRMLTKNGDVRWILGRGMAASRDEQGRATRLVGTHADITQRKQMEEELRQSEKYYRTIFEASGSAMHIIEEDTTISQVNSNAASLSGYSKQEIEGKKSWTEFVHPEDLEWIRKYHYMRRRDPSAAPRSYELRFLGRNGELRHGYQTVALIPGTTQSVVSLVDITDRKEAEERLQVAHNKLETLVQLNAEGLMVLDREGWIQFINPAAAKMLRREQEELLGEQFGYLLTPGSSSEIELLSDSGETRVVEMRGTETVWGGRSALLATFQDITERKQIEEELKQSEKSYRQERDYLDNLFENSADAIAIVDKHGKFSRWNKRSAELFGYSFEEIQDKHFSEFYADQYEMNEILSILRENGVIRDYETNFINKDGTVKPCSISISLLYDEEFELIGSVSIVRDLSEWKKAEQRLKEMGYHDSLTGLYNRNFFEEEMTRLSDGRHSPIGIFILDVDGLKYINDTLGHKSGDNILTITAELLKENFRSSDIIARIGGDEFAVLLPGIDQAGMQNIVERVRSSLEQLNKTQGQIPLSVSLGQALSEHGTPNMAALFREADNRMYREKMQREQSARSSTVQGLIHAMEARDFITEGHSDRLQELVSSLAQEIDMPQQEVNDMMLLARFHDLGKVGIPDRILFKPGPLTEEEFQEMKQHSKIGERIARSTPDLAPIADWIRNHHEKWDGTGYPQGLRGGDIPLPCRILAIADAYDAMISERPYRSAMTREEAIAELRRCSGTQFDPELVERFIRILEEAYNG